MTSVADGTGAGRRAVVVGTAQLRRRPQLDGPWEPSEPAALMAEVVAAALDDAVGPGTTAASLRGDVRLVACVTPMAWPYDDVCGRVAELAALPGAEGLTLPMGGNSPGDLLSEAANRIVDGDLDLAVLAGGESMYSRRRASREGVTLDWTPRPAEHDLFAGQRPFATELEARHGITLPIHAYPLMENALRAAAGRSIDEHQRVLGAMAARASAVAADNPHAWFPAAFTAEQVIEVTPDNRLVCFPYTKRMNAVLDVDMAAALVVMSDEEADRRGIPVERRVAVLGGGGAADAWTVTERRSLTSSAGIAAATGAALDHAALEVTDVDAFDLYSCFPSAVELATTALGIPVDDERGLTVTGGLAYAGGPGNSYAVHSLAAMTDLLRSGSGRRVGLVTSLGMTASKHACTVLSSDRSRMAAAEGRASRRQPPAEATVEPALVEHGAGGGTVESYTVEYDRTGAAVRSILVVRLDTGERTVANGTCSPGEIGELTRSEGVGRRVAVSPGGNGTNTALLTTR